MRTPLTRTGRSVVALMVVLACDTERDGIVVEPRFSSFASSEWSAPVNLGAPVNTSFNEQGPTLSSDGLSLYFGSDRQPGGLGGFDIWVSRRACADCPWEAPENLGPAVNSSAAETGPSMSVDGHLLFFRSNRVGGQGDVYLSRRANPKDDFGWGPPVPLGPGVNTAADEAGAEYLQSAEDGIANLYFNRGVPPAGADLYRVSVTRDGETRVPAELIAELSHPVATDQGPTLRNDGREILFFSNRPGSLANDIWTSTRRSVHHPWAPPVNAGMTLNSAGFDQQPSLADQGRTLLFASNRSPGGFGGTDIWISTRMPGGK